MSKYTNRTSSFNSSQPDDLLAFGEVILHPIEVGDLPHLGRWWQEDEATYYDAGNRFLTPPPNLLETLRLRILNNDLDDWFLITRATDGVPVGYVLYRDYDPLDNSVELGIRLGQDFWSHGYGTDTMVAFLHYLFTGLGFNLVWLNVADFNERAIRLYHKSGFNDEGHSPKGGIWLKMSATPASFYAIYPNLPKRK